MYEQKREHRFCIVTNFNIIMLCLSEKCFTFRIHDFRYLKLIRRSLNALFNTFHMYFIYISLIICPQTAIYPSFRVWSVCSSIWGSQMVVTLQLHDKYINYIFKSWNIKANINCIKLYIIHRTFYIRFGRCTLISGPIVLGERN